MAGRVSARGSCFLIETRVATTTLKWRPVERARSTGEVSAPRFDAFPVLDRACEPPSEIDPTHFISVKTAHTSEVVVTATLKTMDLPA